MAMNWHPDNQYQGGSNGFQQYSAPQSKRQSLNPPPVCFNCGGPHFLVACPQSSGTTSSTTSFAPANASYQQAPTPDPTSQGYSLQHGQAQYPSYPSNQQYGPPASQYSYGPPQQIYNGPSTSTYNTPAPQQQYSRPGFQTQTYNQYSQNQPTPQGVSQGPPQYGAPTYQPSVQTYNNQGPPQFSVPAAPFQSQNFGSQGNFSSTSSFAPTNHQPPAKNYGDWGPMPPASRPTFQKPQRSNSNFKRDISGTPSQHSQQVQRSTRSQSLNFTPEIQPSKPGMITKQTQQSPQKPPTKSANGLKYPNSFSQSNARKASIVEQVKVEQDAAASQTIPSSSTDQETEEGEVRECDEEEEAFKWELEHIFEEPCKRETVALAQPLSAGYDSTPVPLVQAWSSNVPSISRYARKDNLKEFVRSVRHAPQWNYLQEDPAFLEFNDDGELIPLNNLATWMDVHHGRTIEVETVEEQEQNSRKRSRSEGEYLERIDEQDNVDQQIAIEVASDEHEEKPPNKRQKNEEADDLDDIMTTSGSRTPLIMGRGGTPCLPTTDEAWAPEPGETAASPPDPTEYLLNSLGVSGSPKPVKKKEPFPAYQQQDEASQTSKQMHIKAAQDTQASQSPAVNMRGPTPQNDMRQNIPQSLGPPMSSNTQHNAQYGPSASYGNTSAPNVPYSQNAGQYNNPGYAQYGPPTNGPYGPGLTQNMNGPPQHMNSPLQHMNGPTQYSAPSNVPYGNGPPNPYMQDQSNWGPQRNSSFGGGPQYNPTQPYPQYEQYQNAQYGNAQYGPPANQYGNQPPAAYNSGPPQYNQNGNGPYMAGQPAQGQYAPTPHPAVVQYGPPVYGGAPYPNQPQSQPQQQNNPVSNYSNRPPSNAPNGAHAHNATSYPNNLPNQQQQYDNNLNGQAPPRQDSGYASARGSYSNPSAPNGFKNQSTPLQNSTKPETAQPPTINANHNTACNAGKETNPQSQPAVDSTESAEDSPGTPLSPTSAEILGKLVRKSIRKTDQEKVAARKAKKRPAPVVDEAYSRRW